MKFLIDECDVCGRTTDCMRQFPLLASPVLLKPKSICELCSVGSDEGQCSDGYVHRESVRRGGLIDVPVTHAQAWDLRNYNEDMRLRRDMIVVDIKEEL